MEGRKYDPATIEPKWQKYWEEHHTFRAPGPGDEGFDPSRPKYYVLDMFPYPSGAGLHVGHPEGYTATDILARWRRMQGYNVLHPMGWDAFGLPAEQYAVKTGTHPSVTTRANIKTFKRQIQALGFSYDWDREFATTDRKYYRWTQWIFRLLYDTWYDERANKGRPISELPVPAGLTPEQERTFIDSRRLAYTDEIAVWWCPELGTVLANEEVIDGLSERGGYPCFRQPLRQWMLRITAYAERLLEDLELVDWPEETKKQQREWIGRSTGAEAWFGIDAALDQQMADGERVRLQGGRGELKIFTTRPDTLFGATYMVLAPEHPLVGAITTADQRQAVDAYCREASTKSDLDRTATSRQKTGVFTGAYAVNPVNSERIPIWVADYVLASYGTGAIMAVPAHDERDFDFAIEFGLPIVEVVRPDDPEQAVYGRDTERDGTRLTCFSGEGTAVNSPWIDGLPKQEAIETITRELQQRGLGSFKVNYRLRDWIFSRQRYWGEPFPIVYTSDGATVALDETELPLDLPELDDFAPTGRPEPLLAKAQDWVDTVHPVTGQAARRETNTMPNWAGSCWYYLRFCDPHNDEVAWDRDKERYWMPVDLYVGGREHAVLHLLYARFWHKVLYDRGYVSTGEPFKKLFHQGLVLAFAYEDPRTRGLVPTDEVEEHADGQYRRKADGQPLNQIVAKMSKSLKNVVNPDDIIASYGADAFRLYEMFMGPLEAAKPWDSRAVDGVLRFLQRSYRLLVDEHSGEVHPNLRDQGTSRGAADEELERALHRCIKKVTDDLDRMAFNTAIAAMMIFVNEATPRSDRLTTGQAERYVKLLSVFAPHLGEELWQRLGRQPSIAYAEWPCYDQALLAEAALEIPVQVNGKKRALINVEPEVGDDVYRQCALEAVASYVDGKTLVKVIVVPKRLVNVVVR